MCDAVGAEEQKLHAAICRCLNKTFTKQDETMRLIHNNLKYAVTGGQDEANVYLLEKQILDLEESSESYMTMLGNTTGDTQKYMEAIEENFKKISVLRQKLELVRQKADACSEANQELARVEKVLSEETVSFDVCDDIVIRRLVECISVTKDRRIVVILKGGLQAEESF